MDHIADEDSKSIKQAEVKNFVNMEKFSINEIMDMWDMYATKKTATAGFFNIALMTSNLAQLNMKIKVQKLEYSLMDFVVVGAVLISLLLQVLAGIVMVFLGKNKLAENEKIKRMLVKNNDMVTLMVFAIFLINIFINIFIVME